MSDHAPGLDREATEVVFSVTENRDAEVTALALEYFFEASAPALKASGLIRLKGYDLATVSMVDHEHESINVIWSPEHEGYGYFSPAAGWVTVPNDRLAVFEVSFDQLFDRLLERLDLPRRSSRIELAPGLLWEVGDVRLPGRRKRVPLWVGRRLSDPAVWSRFADTVRARAAPGLRVVLSLTPADRLPAQVLNGHEIIAVRDVADHSGLAIDPDLLAARVASGPHQDSDPITMAADGASVTIHGKRYGFTGTKQRAVIRHLHEAWQAGSPECLTAEVLEAAGYSGSVNTLAKAFSRRTDWCEFIMEEHGHCWMFH